MLIYRAMGETDKVMVHEARYRRYKEDEDIRQLTGAFKRADAAANKGGNCQGRTCPLPRTTYLYVVSCSTPTGPRA